MVAWKLFKIWAQPVRLFKSEPRYLGSCLFAIGKVINILPIKALYSDGKVLRLDQWLNILLTHWIEQLHEDRLASSVKRIRLARARRKQNGRQSGGDGRTRSWWRLTTVNHGLEPSQANKPQQQTSSRRRTAGSIAYVSSSIEPVWRVVWYVAAADARRWQLAVRRHIGEHKRQL